MQQALDRVEFFLKRGRRPHSVFAVNPEKNFSVPKDPMLHETFKRADLLIPDGIGVVLAARMLHGVEIARVPGVELMERICELAANRGSRIFLYGAREEVNRKAANVLSRRYPGLRIAGRANGYVKAEEMPKLVDRINRSRADILFLGLGSPRQERWFLSQKDSLDHVRVCQGIGGTLDVIAGNVRRAPNFWRSHGAEWFYRLISEPMRIRRQRVLPLFVLNVLASKLKTLVWDAQGQQDEGLFGGRGAAQFHEDCAHIPGISQS
jgi:N-acetylglucosaminyldiphosphoundecaprenol N-acetyl-beta-D-mannosaminyltransferase